MPRRVHQREFPLATIENYTKRDEIEGRLKAGTLSPLNERVKTVFRGILITAVGFFAITTSVFLAHKVDKNGILGTLLLLGGGVGTAYAVYHYAPTKGYKELQFVQELNAQQKALTENVKQTAQESETRERYSSG